ncbi:MAG: carboxylesterase family protein [Parvibaculum sp.]
MLTNEVEIAPGRIRGTPRDGNGVLSFKGIPYAAPPVGPLRWRPPQPVAPWSGVRPAESYGNTGFGTPIPALEFLAKTASEDCLVLNVWTAATDAAERRPVMLWIHGGGFEFGASFLMGTDGPRLAEAGAVLVSIHYRMGVFGFLAHEELDAEGTPSGNFGLQDMIAALRWVRENITRFGGDPDCVTIFGESAGAHALGMLMVSPLAEGLFHRVIGQSGAWWDSEHGSMPTAQEARMRGAALVKKARVRTIGELRNIPPARLNSMTAWNFLLDPATTAFAPSIDGYVVPATPPTLFAEGRQIKVPLLAGWNAEEEEFFKSRSLPQAPARLRAAAAHQFGEARMADFARLYPSGSKREAKRSAETLIGDLVISQQTWEWLEIHRATSGAPVYGFQFEYTSPFSPRAIHTAELPFVFGTLQPDRMRGGKAAAEADRALSGMMVRYWTHFAKSGNPNGPGLPDWPLYEGANAEVMHFATESAAAPVKGADRFRFIQSFRSQGRLPDRWRGVEGHMSPAAARIARRTVLTLFRLMRLFGWSARQPG